MQAHHYVPQGYLKGFLTIDELYVVNKKYGSIRPTSPAGVAYAPGFYTVDTIDEKDSAQVEQGFSKIEGVCIPIIKKMIAGEYLTKANLADLAIYIALQYGRTPHYRNRMDDVATTIATNLMKEELAKAYNDQGKYRELVEYVRKSAPNLEAPTKDRLKKWILNPGPLGRINIDNGTYVTMFFENVEMTAEELLRRRWIVLRAPRKSSFITSDNPIGLHISRPLDAGETLAILLKDVQRFIPLDAKTCLAIIDEDRFELKTSLVSKDQLRSINRLIYSQAHQYAISGSRPLLLSLKTWHERNN